MKARLTNRLYIPEEEVTPRALSKFQYKFRRYEEQRVEDDAGNLLEIKQIPYIEEHQTYRTKNGVVGFHRGDLGKLKKLFPNLEWVDGRASPKIGKLKSSNPLWMKSGFIFKHNQEECIEAFLASEGGGLVIAPTGWGKTIFGISVALKLGLRTLVLASRTNWLQDWLKDLRKHTNIEELESQLDMKLAGVIDNHTSPDNLFPCFNFSTFATFWSKNGKKTRSKLFRDSFGLVIADEASMLPAKETGGVFTAFNPRWRMGLSADEKRPDMLHRLTYDYIGPMVAKGQRVDTIVGQVFREDSGIVISANHLFGYWLGSLQSKICNHRSFSHLVADRAIEDVKDGYRVIMITKVKKQVQFLAEAIAGRLVSYTKKNGKKGKRHPRVATLMGGDKKFEEKKNLAREGKIDVLVTTEVVQMNTDIERMDCLHDLMPANNDQAIKQRAGRATRAHPDKKKIIRIRIFNFTATPPHHPATRYLQAQWMRREAWYRGNGFEILDIDDDGKIVKQQASLVPASGTSGSGKASFIGRK
jgi:superfamily II DNA or RNA helicase